MGLLNLPQSQVCLLYLSSGCPYPAKSHGLNLNFISPNQVCNLCILDIGFSTHQNTGFRDSIISRVLSTRRLEYVTSFLENHLAPLSAKSVHGIDASIP